MMHGREKSDSAILAGKPTNKAVSTAAEPVERRAEAKGKRYRQGVQIRSGARGRQAAPTVGCAAGRSHCDGASASAAVFLDRAGAAGRNITSDLRPIIESHGYEGLCSRAAPFIPASRASITSNRHGW